MAKERHRSFCFDGSHFADRPRAVLIITTGAIPSSLSYRELTEQRLPGSQIYGWQALARPELLLCYNASHAQKREEVLQLICAEGGSLLWGKQGGRAAR